MINEDEAHAPDDTAIRVVLRAIRTLPVVFRFNRSGDVSRRVIDELPTILKLRPLLACVARVRGRA
jgi:hypothetical protein